MNKYILQYKISVKIRVKINVKISLKISIKISRKSVWKSVLISGLESVLNHKIWIIHCPFSSVETSVSDDDNDGYKQCAVYEEGGAGILIGAMGMIVLLAPIISMLHCWIDIILYYLSWYQFIFIIGMNVLLAIIFFLDLGKYLS